MEAKQSIYYALGILAYAVAKSDGEVQSEERDKLADIVENELEHNLNFQYAEIIFRILEKENRGYENVYNWAMDELKKGRHFLNDEIKNKMLSVMREIAEAFHPVTLKESSIIDRFENDIKKIGSDHLLK